MCLSRTDLFHLALDYAIHFTFIQEMGAKLTFPNGGTVLFQFVQGFYCTTGMAV